VLGLDFERILLDTRGQWANIGEDFVARLDGPQPGSAPDETVVPFRRADVPAGPGPWASARAHLSAEDPALFDAWFAGLHDGGVEGDCLTLIAPSRFHATYLRTHFMARLTIAVQRADGRIARVRIQA
jgi:hypothetical protein